MEEIRFLHSRKSASALTILFGLLFGLFLVVTIAFIKDLAEDLSLSKVVPFLAISALPSAVVVLFGLKFIRNLKNNRPVCTLGKSELTYTEFSNRGTYVTSIQLRKIREVKTGKTLIDNKKTITLKLDNEVNGMRLLYLDSVMSEADKLVLIAEIEKRIAIANTRLPK